MRRVCIEGIRSSGFYRVFLSTVWYLKVFQQEVPLSVVSAFWGLGSLVSSASGSTCSAAWGSMCCIGCHMVCLAWKYPT